MLKVGLISQAYSSDMKAHTSKKISQLKADLIVLQELHQSAYFCQVENVNNFDLANDFDKDCEYWSKIAKENNVVLVTSLFEKRACGLYHNSAVVFEKDGSIAGKYRKMHIPDDPHFYEKFYFTPGDLGFNPIKTSVGSLGVLVCWDQWFCEAARIMALKGADILIYPTAIGWLYENKLSDNEEIKKAQLNAWLSVQRAHAISNGLPVVGVNRVGFESVKLSGNSSILQDEKIQNNAKNDDLDNGILFWGNSFVYDAQGKELFKSNEDDEVCVCVDVDLEHSKEVRTWWPFLRDRRIEHYSDLLKLYCD